MADQLSIDFVTGLVADLIDHDREINRLHGPEDSQRRFRDGEINGLQIVHRILVGGTKIGAQTYVNLLTGHLSPDDRLTGRINPDDLEPEPPDCDDNEFFQQADRLVARDNELHRQQQQRREQWQRDRTYSRGR